MNSEKPKPFTEVLRALLAERDLSLRDLAKLTQKKAGWGSITTMSFLARGAAIPTIEAMEHIAAALNVSPDLFAEYRLAKARLELDPAEVGLKTALENYENR